MSTPIFIAEPPEGVARDIDGQTLVQQRIITDSSITLSIACVILACRLYSRAFITRSIELDDYAVLLAMCFAVVFLVCCLYGMKNGLGKHYWDVPVDHGQRYLTLMIPAVISYCWCPMMTKSSLLIFFHQLNAPRYFRYFIYILASIMVGYTVVTTIIAPALCIKPTGVNDSCMYSLTLWQGILNIVTDAIVLALPIPLLWGLRLPFSQKLGAGVVFALGSLVIIASIIRIRYILLYQGQVDFTYYQATTINLSASELNCGIVCSCLAVMKPFILHLVPALNPSPNTDGTSAPSNRSGSKFFLKKPRRLSFRLGRVGRQSLPDDSLTNSDGKPGIVVTNSYHVDIDENGRSSRSDSMENIIPYALRSYK